MAAGSDGITEPLTMITNFAEAARDKFRTPVWFSQHQASYSSIFFGKIPVYVNRVVHGVPKRQFLLVIMI